MCPESATDQNASPDATTQEVMDAVQELEKAVNEKKKKDAWDKFAAVSTFISSVIIAILGFWFTHSYRVAEAEGLLAQQHRERALRELDAIAQFMPYLTGIDEDAKEVAIKSISALAGVRVAALMAELNPSVGSALALKDIASAPTTTLDERVMIRSAAEHVYDSLPSQEILFATNRKRSELDKQTFGTERGELTFGSSMVSFPLKHKAGEIETPSIFGMELRVQPTRHMNIYSVESVQQESFIALLKERVENTERQSLLVFVHGFNVGFEHATLRLAQIAFDLQVDGVPVLFSWPSGESVLKYAGDQAKAAWSAHHLATFLRSLQRESGATRISIIADGLGCRMVATALEEIGPADSAVLIDQLVFVSADIDRKIFEQAVAPRLAALAGRTTLYVSPNDLMLLASSRMHDSPRLGDASSEVPVVPGVDTVFAPGNETMRHEYVGSQAAVLADIGMVLQGTELSGRLVSSRPTAGGVYWVLD